MIKASSKRFTSLLLCGLALTLPTRSRSQQLAPTPPMGWNSWYAYHTNISDSLIRSTADELVSSGLRDRGYIYVNLDDGWEGPRDASGNITAGPNFPDMKALASYLHARGLKFGIYSSPAKRTPAGFVGSFGHASQDAAVFASWGVDFLKYDWGYATKDYPSNDVQGTFEIMRKALDATGRRIVFSISAPADTEPWKWAPVVGAQLSRVGPDIEDSWKPMSHIGFDIGANLTPFPEPGYWNDPDMLQVGIHGMSEDEYRTQVSLWSLLAAPLLISNNLHHMTQSDLRVLSNPEVIAIDQDALGKSGYRLRKEGNTEVWIRQLASDQWVIGLFNRGINRKVITVSSTDLRVPVRRFLVRDVWARRTVHRSTARFTASVPAHGVVLMKLQPPSTVPY